MMDSNGNEIPNGPLESGPVPLYFRLERSLLDRITNGEFREGDPLPTEETLCTEYGVSRITVRRALDRLATKRLVLRQRGRGTFVAASGAGVKSVRLVGFLDDTLAYTRELSYRIISLGASDPDPLVAGLLKLEKGEKVVRLEALILVNAGPFAYTNFFFPEFVGRSIKRSDVRNGVPILRIVEEKSGQSISRGEQTVLPSVADAKTSKLLKIGRNTPILRVHRTYYGKDGRPVEVAVVRYHPERYDFTVELVTHPE